VSALNLSTDDILEKALDGERLSVEEGVALFGVDNLPVLGSAAHEIRKRHHPEPVVTYVVDRNINYTNICVSGCLFCAFHRQATDPDAYVLSRDELFRKIDELVSVGGTQILMQGGLHPELRLDYYCDMLRAIKERYDIHIHTFSPPEIVHFARIEGMSVAEVIRTLRDAGLDTIPGGGAEILVQSVRDRVSPRKCTAEEWISVMRDAHSIGMRTTATMMFGHVETYADRIEHLRKVRELQDETGGFTAFIPWTFQPGNTGLPLRTVGGHEYLKTLAICRIFLDNFSNIQASWVTQGAKVGQIALYFGANDLGSTMLEENVVRAAGVQFRMSIEDMRRLISEAGFEPVQRNCYYEPVEEGR
jgi:cyclic dehypoxanthinyl futalosine synthase